MGSAKSTPCQTIHSNLEDHNFIHVDVETSSQVLVYMHTLINDNSNFKGDLGLDLSQIFCISKQT